MLKLYHNYEGGKWNYDIPSHSYEIKSQKYVIVYVIM